MEGSILNIDDNLNQREKDVLTAVVRDFIFGAVPVSSKYVQSRHISDLSTATIRNTMNDLEKKGYLTHPYTSAGRVPTDFGYRYYVNLIYNAIDIKNETRMLIENELNEASLDISIIMDKASQLLGQLSNELGIFIAPSFAKGILEKIDLISLSSERILVVLEIHSGLVKTVMMEIKTRIDESRLPLIASLLNERLYGISLDDIIDTIDKRCYDLNSDPVIQLIVDDASNVFNFSHPSVVKLSGTRNLMSKPEFHNMKKISRIVNQIEDGTLIAHISEIKCDESEVVITIGSENENSHLSDLSFVTKSYSIGRSCGAVAIVGPKRMDYIQTITLVDCIADFVTSIFKDKRSN